MFWMRFYELYNIHCNYTIKDCNDLTEEIFWGKKSDIAEVGLWKRYNMLEWVFLIK